MAIKLDKELPGFALGLLSGAEPCCCIMSGCSKAFGSGTSTSGGPLTACRACGEPSAMVRLRKASGTGIRRPIAGVGVSRGTGDIAGPAEFDWTAGMEL